MLGADSRTSNGNYVANRVTDKLTQLTDRVCHLRQCKTLLLHLCLLGLTDLRKLAFAFRYSCADLDLQQTPRI